MLLEKCCCCLKLETGARVLAVVGFVMEAFVLVSTIYFQLWGMAMDIALTAVGIAANVALFYGAIVRNAKAVQGYLVAASAKGAVALARLGRVLYKYALKSEWGKDLHNDQAAFATHLTASVFNLVLNIYFWVAVYSYYWELKSRETEEKTTSPRKV